MEFSDEFEEGWGTRPFSRSFDRINARKGYVKGNLRVVCWCENRAIGEWGMGVYDKMCKARVRRLLR